VTKPSRFPGKPRKLPQAHSADLESCSFWSKVNSYTHTPVNAVWLVVLFSVCLNLIGIGSTQTVVAIFNVTAPALDLSYVANILAHRVYEHKVRFIEGPYTLGKYGKYINAIAICWVCFISVVLFFPPVKPVTPANMSVSSRCPPRWESFAERQL
jgi:amino acid transporter